MLLFQMRQAQPIRFALPFMHPISIEIFIKAIQPCWKSIN